MKGLGWLIAATVIAGVGPQGMAPTMAGDDCSCTARHETVVKRSAEKYFAWAPELVAELEA